MTDTTVVEETWSPKYLGGSDTKKDFIARCHVEVPAGGFLRFGDHTSRTKTWLDVRLMGEYISTLEAKVRGDAYRKVLDIINEFGESPEATVAIIEEGCNLELSQRGTE